MSYKLFRDQSPEEGLVFFAMPFGEKKLSDGSEVDFDEVFTDAFVPAVTDCGMKPLRADSIYGLSGVFDTVWQGIQKAEVVVVDFTTKAPNVALEFALALILHKRIIVVTQDPADIPTDIAGVYRYIRYSEHFKAMNRMRTELTRELREIRKDLHSEMALVPMFGPRSETVSAKVIAVEREYVTVKAFDGRLGLLGNADVEYTRIVRDMNKLFRVGDEVKGAFVVDTTGAAKFTKLADKTNPWLRLESDFPVGHSFVGTVQTVLPGKGVFVRVANEINGFVPERQFGGRLPRRDDEITVRVSRVDVGDRQIQLEFAARQHAAPDPVSVEIGITVGHTGYGKVLHADIKRGFLLLSMPELTRPGLLHVRNMSDELRQDMLANEVEVGEEIYVEVRSIDLDRGRVELAEADDPEDVDPDAGEPPLQVAAA